jgi:tetratricopeptide (TPR) repeat protein
MAGASGGTDDPVWIASLLNTMALMHIRKGEFREAQGFLEKANTIAADPKNRDLDLILSSVQNNIGDCLRAQGNLAGSKEFLLKALESANRLNAPDDPQLAYNHVNLGKLLMAMDRFAEAQTCFQKALALQQPLDPTHPDIALTLREYAPLLEMLKQPTEAAAARKRAEEIRAINLNQLVKANE